VAPSSVPSVLRLGTRGGDLALWQAREVARLITERHPDVIIQLQVIRTAGDRQASTPIEQVGGTGVFTREIEQALRDGRIDLAVHSLKDLPTRLGEGLTLAAIPGRADARDALVAPPGTRLDGLPHRARIGTSSARRRAQLLALRPDLLTLDLRGNVPTRLAKLDRGDYDAIVLACAGLHRLGLADRIAETLEPDIVMPAPGQGALAVEARIDDAGVIALAAAIDHRPTRLAVAAERACLGRLEGGCQAPVGALATWAGDTMTAAGAVLSAGGDRVARARIDAVPRAEADAVTAGLQLADRLLELGAAEILSHIRPAGRDGGAASDLDTP
jgi:hydroxymethylbilane synthase